MLHNYERISQIFKIHKCTKQLVVIPLMQSDTWLIKYICHTDKPRSNLCGKPDSLCFPA